VGWSGAGCEQGLSLLRLAVSPKSTSATGSNRKSHLICPLFGVFISVVIQSFADTLTEKLFLGAEMSRRELNKLGTLNPVKAFERLAILNESDEKALRLIPALHYHKLKGSTKYSIDADSRKSPWRITFQWENAEMRNVGLVKIEDTH
jgi:plasmid maintenance system killer protein